MTRLDKIIDAINNYHGCGGYFGNRSDDRSYDVGNILPASRVWADNNVTDEILDGTSTTGIRYIEDAGKALTYHEASYNYGQPMYLVAGDLVGYGEDAGEYIISDAEVIAIL